jgi:lipoyl(octanoyl) transferase
MKNPCLFYDCPSIDYLQAWQWQKSLRQERIDNPDLPDALILLEHPAVYTLGRGSSLEYLNFSPDDPNYRLYRIERGGEVTHHCPGQLVGYPILSLRRHQMDLHWYLRRLEEVIIGVLGIYGLQGDRIAGLTGVWVGGEKIAAIGIGVSRWVTMHGFALNVCPDLSGFDRIVPCGIADRSVTSMARFIPDLDPVAVRSHLAAQFAHVFGLELRIGATTV